MISSSSKTTTALNLIRHWRPERELKQPFLNRNMDYYYMDAWEVNSSDPVTEQRVRSMAYYNTFNTNTGVIVAKGNYRSADKEQKLQWSEIMYQTWQLATANAYTLAAEDRKHPPGGPISNIRSEVQHVVTNQGTKAVLRAAYEANNWRPGQDDAEEWREWTEASTRSFFWG
ncbi:MAG: hypothetical protein Q9166_006469 [cf. Caloplaca sp. 2 TL-2023]